MKKSKSLQTLALLTTMAFVGCAKEKPFDEQYKAVELMSKSNFVTEETVQLEDGTTVTRPVEYIYVPMTLGTPMNVTDADPFFQGDEKLVRLAWSEEGLEVREIERDRRFADNDLNQYPIMTIPGDYKSFRCREDAYGECTNVEEENTELEWYDKDNFMPKFEALKEKEVNMLDMFGTDNNSCLSPGDTYIVDYEVKPGVINIELEKNYKVNGRWWCFIKGFILGDLSINGFRVRKFYSLVRRDMLVTPGYQAIKYPERDHSEFGFFTREEETLNDDFDRNRKKQEILMERWNPGTPDDKTTADVNEYSPRIVEYHLSPEYTKPQNKDILDATMETIEVMNREMRDSNVPLQLKMIAQDYRKKGVSAGDLRYNHLVLIEDPLANGLLGYGPAVSDPYTGEIIKAHTNMYLGVLKSMTRRTYQAAVDLLEERYNAQNSPQAATGGYQASIEALSNLPEALALAHFPDLIEERLPELPRPAPAPADDSNSDDSQDDDAQGDDAQGDVAEGEEGNQPAPQVEEGTPVVADNNGAQRRLRNFKKLLSHKGHGHLSKAEIERKLRGASFEQIQAVMENRLHMKKGDQKAAIVLERLKEEGRLSKEQEVFLKEMARLDRYAENNALAVEFFPIGGTSKVVYPELLEIPGIQTERGTLKPFDSLTDAQKNEVNRIVTKSAYKATLVHELGHNLGLRHNFMGSWDKANFYTDEEARALGMNAAVPYSSIMDYSFSEFNQLKAFGKYDLAALRFGYNREVELNDGKFVRVQGSIFDFKNELKTQGKELKPYAFCTDENAGLNTSCNRFDEGTSIVEITNHLIKRYKDRYKYSNFRDGRLSFNTYDFPTYIMWRQWEFGKIRDVMEEFELYATFVGADFMAQGCTPDLVQQYPDFCGQINDRRDAVKVVTDFLTEMLVMPDHLCALVKEDKPNIIVEYRKLSEIYEDVKYDDTSYVPTSCFDKPIVDKVAEDDPNTPENDKRLIVGETGKFFNGFKDANPNFRYAQDRYAFGIWPDKIFAFEALFDRTWNRGNTDDGHMALMDISFVREKVEPILDHLILGKPIPQTVPFSTADGKTFSVPYAISKDYQINPIEKVFWWLKDFLGLPTGEGAKGNLLTSSLHMLKINVDYGDEYEDQAFETRNLTAVTQLEGYVAPQFRNPEEDYYYDSRNRMTFAADEYTPYARKMIKTLNNFDTLEAAGRPIALKVANQRLRPEPPATVPVPVQVFWSMEDDLQETLINVARAGRTFSQEEFIQFFGPQLGPILLAVYQQGPDFMQAIVDMKNEVRNTVPADASDEEKALFNLPADLVDDYAKGLITKDVLDFYVDTIRNLPYRQRARTNDINIKL